MYKETIMFGDIEISKYSININNVDIDEMIISEKDSLSKKGFKYSLYLIPSKNDWIMKNL